MKSVKALADYRETSVEMIELHREENAERRRLDRAEGGDSNPVPAIKGQRRQLPKIATVPPLR